MTDAGLATILLMARDAGAASALVPVARTLLADRLSRLVVLGFRQAEAVFRQEGLPVRACTDDADPWLAPALVGAERPDVVVTGTSMKVERDAAFWGAASDRGVSSLAVVDHWANLTARFTVEGDPPFARVPDTIAVMDAVARDRMVAGGCPPERVLVTGQPYFDDFDALTPDQSADLRDEARWALGVAADCALLVFASEPQARFYGSGPADPEWLGYTEDEVLGMVVHGLGQIGPGGRPVQLLVKLHPLEGPERLAPVLAGLGVQAFMLRHFPPRALIAAADVVVGMTSVFLIEAALMGRPALSLQPRRHRTDSFVEHHEELIGWTADPDGFADFLRGALMETEGDWAARVLRASALGFDGQAARRVVGALYQAVARAKGVRGG